MATVLWGTGFESHMHRQLGERETPKAPKWVLNWTETDGAPFSTEKEQNISMKVFFTGVSDFKQFSS